LRKVWSTRSDRVGNRVGVREGIETAHRPGGLTAQRFSTSQNLPGRSNAAFLLPRGRVAFVAPHAGSPLQRFTVKDQSLLHLLVTSERRTLIDVRLSVIDDREVVMSKSGIVVDDCRAR